MKKGLKKGLTKSLKKKPGSVIRGFKKSGQIKVSQDPEKGLRKLGEDEKEYGIDELVDDSIKEEDAEEESADAERE